jgi:hypothetical protein
MATILPGNQGRYGWWQGWECPKCEAIYGPTQKFCPRCSPKGTAFFVIPEDLNLSPTQMRELQDALHAVTTDLEWEHKLILLPPKARIVSEFNV